MLSSTSLPSLVRSSLLSAALLLTFPGAAQADELAGTSAATPTVNLPDDSELSEEASRVHRRSRRRARRAVRSYRSPQVVYSAQYGRTAAHPRSRRVVVQHRVFRPPAPIPKTPTFFPKGSWVHVGGGLGTVAGEVGDNRTASAARFVAGGGAFNHGFYGGGEVSVTGSKLEPFELTGAGFVGAAIPIPVFQPMIGVRAGAGQHLIEGELRPHLNLGPQLGFIARKAAGRPGLRLMVDLGVDYGIEERQVTPELFVTVAAVF
ncbi:MAG: hypothetical protein VX498_09200 [Myxococcota bacterium]|nr:hypothetical protein [Myxococcota bacterium]